MKSNEINKLINSFRNTLLSKTTFTAPQIETIIGFLRTQLINLPTPEEPPASYKEALEKSERKSIEKLRQESPAFNKLVEEMSKTPGPELKSVSPEIGEKFLKCSKAASDKVGTGLVLIPLYSLLNLGKIFIEGLRYGRDNWKKGVNNKEYQEERLEHAILHLIKYKEGDRSEEHLAKVSWFCFTQLELERLEHEISRSKDKENTI